MTTAEQTEQPKYERREPFMVVRNRPEPRWWRQDNDGAGHWHSDNRPGPGMVISVGPEGIYLTGVPSLMGPRETRWLASRLAEAPAVYELEFGGDGSQLNAQAESWVVFPPSEPDPVDLRLRRSTLADILEGVIEA